MPLEGMPVADLAASYDTYFEVRRADTSALLDEAYRLRYQVYCVENAFLDPNQRIPGQESDDDDDRSVHTLLVHKRTGLAAGTARVVLPGRQPGTRLLQIQRVLSSEHRRTFDRLPLERTGEISRFAVSKEFRRRGGEERYPDVAYAEPPATTWGERRLMPHITFGLVRGLLEICVEHGITIICAVMEPALIRLVGRMGLDFEPLGGIVEYHGWRQPCLAHIEDLIGRSRGRGSLLWHYAEATTPAALSTPVAAARS
jgi:N-acyl amino acid synthase of PEP-CTERM/exosortase system